MSPRTLTAPMPEPRRTRRAPGLSLTTRPGSLPTWYLGLVPYWMNAKPGVKCRLLLRTHEWIIDRVLPPEVSLDTAIADLGPDGELTRALTALVPADDAAEWRHFIDVVVANLRHALQLPVTRRNEAWVRWLFLIPYSAAPAGA
ncbi:MAG TPA: hypothetical protein VL086_11195 [Candidatus Nitrosotalea sp.]|nr:hypothetical protein [Candidatus Nitrosotalea sp.]